jgi:hypothetical protein
MQFFDAEARGLSLLFEEKEKNLLTAIYIP